MTGRLKDAPWTSREDLSRLTEAIGHDNLRWVGGAVRDTLLGFRVADVDAATLLAPDEVRSRCEGVGLRVVDTGIAHGTLTIVLPGGPVEVTTVRRDVATDGRRATIALASNWREDAARRDFTINALYAHPGTLAVDDYFNGLEDLAARKVRFIGDPATRIREDHLRILRYFRFQARFADSVDEAALAACRELAPTLKGISRERIASELLLLLSLPAPAATVRLMERTGVLPTILPEAAARTAALERLAGHETKLGIEPDPIRRLAALLPPSEAVAEGVAARLRLSKAQRTQLVCAANRAPDAIDVRELAYRVGLRCARDRLLLQGEDCTALDTWTVPDFPLRGRDVIARGVEAGPRIAKVLRLAEERWIAAGFPPREPALQLLDNVLAE
jgi:poly(A) polymerase